MDHDKFQANGKHIFRPSVFKTNGGVNVGEGTVVICDLDAQPHGLNGHYSGARQSLPCQRPVKWTSGGVEGPKEGMPL